MRKSKATGSAAASAHVSKAVKGSANSEVSGAASKSKLATKRRVHAGQIARPVQLTIFDYAASVGVKLLPEAS